MHSLHRDMRDLNYAGEPAMRGTATALTRLVRINAKRRPKDFGGQRACSRIERARHRHHSRRETGGPSGRVSNEIRDDRESEGSEGDRGHSATARLLQSACR